MVCVSYQISVLVLADPVHLYAVLAHLCQCSCAVRLRIGLCAEVQEIGRLLEGDAFEVLLVVLFDDRRRVVTDDGREPVAVARADHCVHRCIALVGSCELDLVRAVLQDDYRRLLKLLYSAATVGGIDESLYAYVCRGCDMRSRFWPACVGRSLGAAQLNSPSYGEPMRKSTCRPARCALCSCRSNVYVCYGFSDARSP